MLAAAAAAVRTSEIRLAAGGGDRTGGRCGTWIGYPLSLSRILVFFPLFLLGHRLGARRLQHLGASGLRKCIAIVVLAAAAGTWWLRDLDPEWLYAAVGYAALQVAALPGAGERPALLCASALCALAVLALVPRRFSRTGLGRHSLTVYLMHGFAVRGLLAAGAFEWLAGAISPIAGVVACLAAGAALAAALSTTWIAARLAAPLTRPAAW